MRSVLLFAAVGPNPASVAEAIWALHRHRGLSVSEVHAVSLEEGHYWLERELIGDAGILRELRAFDGVLPAGDAAVFERITKRADGTLVADDEGEPDAAAYRAAIWEAARDCVARAGDRPVIFVLAGGRRRTITAYTTTVYQLLARAGDELVDVRVSDRRAEGGSGFYYPEQRQVHLLVGDDVLDVRTVQVTLVPVAVPRLAPLLAGEQFASFEAALAQSQHAIESTLPPKLTVDLAAGVVRVNGLPVPFTAGQVAWYGLLAANRVRDASGTGEVPADATSLITQLLAPIAKADWSENIKDYTVRAALGAPLPGDSNAYTPAERLSKLRADTRRTLDKWLDAQVRPGWKRFLMPAPRKGPYETFQRLPLEPAHIELVWPP